MSDEDKGDTSNIADDLGLEPDISLSKVAEDELESQIDEEKIQRLQERQYEGPEAGLDKDEILTYESDTSLSLTPIAAETVVLNPKVDAEPIDLQCPECGETIEGVSGFGAEYRCGCDEPRKFRIRGSEDKNIDESDAQREGTR